MRRIIFSEQAYEELKTFLDSEIRDYNVRINITGSRCSGAAFNLSAGEIQTDDMVEKVNDVNFIVKQALIDELAGFTILSSRESNKAELLIKPFNTPKRECRLCGRGCP